MARKVQKKNGSEKKEEMKCVVVEERAIPPPRRGRGKFSLGDLEEAIRNNEEEEEDEQEEILREQGQTDEEYVYSLLRLRREKEEEERAYDILGRWPQLMDLGPEKCCLAKARVYQIAFERNPLVHPVIHVPSCDHHLSIVGKPSIWKLSPSDYDAEYPEPIFRRDIYKSRFSKPASKSTADSEVPFRDHESTIPWELLFEHAYLELHVWKTVERPVRQLGFDEIPESEVCQSLGDGKIRFLAREVFIPLDANLKLEVSSRELSLPIPTISKPRSLLSPSSSSDGDELQIAYHRRLADQEFSTYQRAIRKTFWMRRFGEHHASGELRSRVGLAPHELHVRLNDMLEESNVRGEGPSVYEVAKAAREAGLVKIGCSSRPTSSEGTASPTTLCANSPSSAVEKVASAGKRGREEEEEAEERSTKWSWRPTGVDGH